MNRRQEAAQAAFFMRDGQKEIIKAISDNRVGCQRHKRIRGHAGGVRGLSVMVNNGQTNYTTWAEPKDHGVA